jgi:hypothetical protein
VEHAQDFESVTLDAAGHHVAGPRDHKLARAGDATRPAESRLVRQLSDSLENSRNNQTRSHRIIGRAE